MFSCYFFFARELFKGNISALWSLDFLGRKLASLLLEATVFDHFHAHDCPILSAFRICCGWHSKM